MITNGRAGLKGMLKPASDFPEDSFTLKTVTVDDALPNL